MLTKHTDDPNSIAALENLSGADEANAPALDKVDLPPKVGEQDDGPVLVLGSEIITLPYIESLPYTREIRDGDDNVTGYKVYIFGTILPNLLSLNLLDAAMRNTKESMNVEVYLDTNGGCCATGFQIISALKKAKCQVTVHAVGRVFSMGTAIFGAFENTVIHPYSMFMFHDVATGFYGRTHERRLSQNYTELLNTQILENFLEPILPKEFSREFKQGEDIYVSGHKLDLVLKNGEVLAEEAITVISDEEIASFESFTGESKNTETPDADNDKNREAAEPYNDEMFSVVKNGDTYHVSIAGLHILYGSNPFSFCGDGHQSLNVWLTELPANTKVTLSFGNDSGQNVTRDENEFYHLTVLANAITASKADITLSIDAFGSIGILLIAGVCDHVEFNKPAFLGIKPYAHYNKLNLRAQAYRGVVHEMLRKCVDKGIINEQQLIQIMNEEAQQDDIVVIKPE